MSSQLAQKKQLNRRLVMRKRIFSRGFVNFKRNLWLSIAACAVMSITLLTVFISGTATLILSDTVNSVKTEKLNLSLVLRNGTPEEIYKHLEADLLDDSNVIEVSISNSSELAAKMREQLDEQSKAAMDEFGIGAETAPIQMTIKAKNLDDTASIKAIVTDDLYHSYVDEKNFYNQQFYNNASSSIVKTISTWAQYAQIGGLILSGIFLLISILVIFNTIRMAIFARREEIEMEKLIGAERSYVRGPFLVEAQLYGLFAGAIAAGGGYAILNYVLPFLRDNSISLQLVADYMLGWRTIIVVIFVILIGIIIGDLSARLAVRKYLKY